MGKVAAKPCHLGVPNVARKSKWPQIPCRIGGPHVGKMATWPLLLGVPNWGGNQSDYMTLAVLGVPKAVWNQTGYISPFLGLSRAERTERGCITPTFSGRNKYGS